MKNTWHYTLMVGVRNALPDYQVFTPNNTKKGRNTKTVGWAGVGTYAGGDE